MRKIIFMISFIFIFSGCVNMRNIVGTSNQEEKIDNVIEVSNQEEKVDNAIDVSYQEEKIVNTYEFPYINDNLFVAWGDIYKEEIDIYNGENVKLYKDKEINVKLDKDYEDEEFNRIYNTECVVFIEDILLPVCDAVPYVYLLDLNEKDEFKEIAVNWGGGPDEYIDFYRYDGEKIIELGGIDSVCSTCYIDTETGVIVGDLIYFLPGNVAKAYWKIENNKLIYVDNSSNIIGKEYIMDRDYDFESKDWYSGDLVSQIMNLKLGDKVKILGFSEEFSMSRRMEVEVNGKKGYVFFGW